MMCELPTRVVVGVEGTWEVLVRGVEGTPDIVEVDEERVCVTCGRDLGEEIRKGFKQTWCTNQTAHPPDAFWKPQSKSNQ